MDALNPLTSMRACFEMLVSDNPEVVATLTSETREALIVLFRRNADALAAVIDERITQPAMEALEG